MSALSGIEMPLRWLRRLPIPKDRIGHLVLSAFLLATANTFGSSLAAARFLSTQGGEGIAIYYIVFALVSKSAWAVYARMIDSGSRVVLLQRFMVTVIATTALLILASGFGGTAADYALYTGIERFEILALQRLSSGADRLSDCARNDALFRRVSLSPCPQEAWWVAASPACSQVSYLPSGCSSACR